MTDLKEYYFGNRVGFFGTFARYGVLAGFTAVIVRGLPVRDPSHLFRLALVLLMLIVMRSASARVHAIVFILCAGLMSVFIALFQFRLG